jgi:hypothetical protein
LPHAELPRVCRRLQLLRRFAITAAGTREIEGFALAPHIEFAFLYGRTADEINPVDDGVAVMEALRQNPVRFANGSGARGGRPCSTDDRQAA